MGGVGVEGPRYSMHLGHSACLTMIQATYMVPGVDPLRTISTTHMGLSAGLVRGDSQSYGVSMEISCSAFRFCML
jgi:hypothetical protein